jgi:hypothetical protein
LFQNSQLGLDNAAPAEAENNHKILLLIAKISNACAGCVSPLEIRHPRADTSIMPTRSGQVPSVSSEQARTSDDDHQVIPFRPRNVATSGSDDWRLPVNNVRTDVPEDLAKFERGEGDDDYRHRMLMNLAAFVVTIVLATAGAWLAITLAEVRKNQDCVLSGRRNCAPIDVQSLPPR